MSTFSDDDQYGDAMMINDGSRPDKPIDIASSPDASDMEDTIMCDGPADVSDIQAQEENPARPLLNFMLKLDGKNVNIFEAIEILQSENMEKRRAFCNRILTDHSTHKQIYKYTVVWFLDYGCEGMTTKEKKMFKLKHKDQIKCIQRNQETEIED